MATLLFNLNLAPLYDAIFQVESDRGATSKNLFQIREEYYADVCRICKSSGYATPPPYDVLVRDRDFAQLAMFHYWRYYAQHYRLIHPTRPITYELLARMHNGGPYGYSKQSTVPYWAKVKKQLILNGGIKNEK